MQSFRQGAEIFSRLLGLWLLRICSKKICSHSMSCSLIVQSGLAVSIQATGLAYRIAGYLQALGLKLTPSGEAALSNLKSQAPKVHMQAYRPSIRACFRGS